MNVPMSPPSANEGQSPSRPVHPRRRATRAARRSLALGGWEALEGRTVPSTLTVTTAADSGPGSLRQAILDADAAAGASRIEFSIAAPPGAAVVIAPTSPLPAITAAATIDATTEPGYAGTPLIVLQGASADAAVGLSIQADGVTVRGLAIGGFAGDGITITGSNNIIEGNFIGLGADGSSAMGNGNRGILIAGGSNNRIGTDGDGRDDPSEGNLISANGADGVDIGGAGPAPGRPAVGNIVAGNKVGTDASGRLPRPNGYDGVAVHAGASATTIGGTTAAARNLLSGNVGHGIAVYDSAGTIILGNWVGVNADGYAAPGLGNLHGITLVDAPNTRVGAPGAGNVASGNNNVGIETYGSPGTILQGNLVGTDATGAGPAPNVSEGIDLHDGSSSFTIGGSGPGEGNVIAYNKGDGVFIRSGSGFLVQGNRIGVDLAGNAAGNAFAGLIVSASGSTIGGPSAGAGNIVSNNQDVGVYLFGGSNVVQGNRIGTDVAGLVAMGNGRDGIQVFAPGNVIGGAGTGPGNLVSGNRGDGIHVIAASATGTLIQGNSVGTNAGGTGSVANGFDGIVVDIGDTTILGNLVAGNANVGITLNGGPAGHGNVARGNRIGTTADGTAAIPNNGGFWIYGPNNTIGGTAPGDANLVSGSRFVGITLHAAGATGNLVLANRIGTSADGTAAVGNGGTGIEVDGPSNTIGGTAAGAGNLVSGNHGAGLWIEPDAPGNQVIDNLVGTDLTGGHALGNGGHGLGIGSDANTILGNTIAASGGANLFLFAASANNTVQGNRIGTDLAGHVALGSGWHGVVIADSSSSNTIGGTTTGAGNLISGNGGAGLDVFGSGTGNVVEGNRIGTDAEGNAPVGNGWIGILLETGGDTIGGSATGAGNLISGNSSNGIWIGPWAPGNLVQGNLVGTDLTGGHALGNGGHGLGIGSDANTILGNTIAASGGANLFLFAASANNTVQGNRIGTDLAGHVALGSGWHGVVIADSSSSNTIGGTTTGAGNLISGNGGAGIDIYGNGTGNVVKGNRIGTNAEGNAPLGNGWIGVRVEAGHNTIGGPEAGAGNLISGNASNGVEIVAGATGVLIQGNRIGTNAAGTLAIGNGGSGIYDDSDGDTIVGNVLSGNAEQGLAAAGGPLGNDILGNRIGTDAAGIAPLGNNGNGIFIYGNGNRIGGTAPGVGNLVAFNGAEGILTGSAANLIAGNVVDSNAGDGITLGGLGGNTVVGNLVGTDASGSVALGNGNNGFLVDSPNNLLTGNLSSANGGNGIDLHGTGNVARGNDFGTGLNGLGALGNRYDGVFLSGPGNTLGGPNPGDRNIIAGNRASGVGVSAPGALIAGNWIGLDANGAALGNAGNGVVLGSSAGTVQGNTIAANGASGVLILGAGASNNQVLGNAIGTDASGHALGNGGDGIWIQLGATGNVVGGPDAGANTIANNNTAAAPGGGGIVVTDAATVGNTFRGNSIRDNTGLGIDLGADGVTANQVGVAGPNGLQSYPDLLAATVTGGTTRVVGTLTTAPNATVVLDFYSNPAPDPSGHGEGSTYLGHSDPLVADASGLIRFSVPLPTAVPLGDSLSATATGSGGTSEFTGDVNAQASGIYVLDRTADGALSLSGNATIHLSGTIVVDSSSASAVAASGNAQVVAASLQVVGGIHTSGNASLGAAVTTGAPVATDPFAALSAPAAGVARGAVNLTKGSLTIDPGVYSQINVSGNAILTMNPGVYEIAGGGFTVGGNAVVNGAAVTVYNAGSSFPAAGGSFGGIALGGNGGLHLSAPSSGPYAGVLLFQARDNTRALAFSGNGTAGMSGAVYAPAALLALSGGSQESLPLVVDKLILSGNATSTMTADGSDATGDSTTAGQLLAGDLQVDVDNADGLFTPEELSRIDDAVAGLDALLVPYGVAIHLVGPADAATANLVLDASTTTAYGGVAAGILGTETDLATSKEVTLVSGWDWYTGSDPAGITPGQYDFETVAVHELGHALGLGHSPDPASAMHATLPTGVSHRSLTVADLAIPDSDGGQPAALHVAPAVLPAAGAVMADTPGSAPAIVVASTVDSPTTATVAPLASVPRSSAARPIASSPPARITVRTATPILDPRAVDALLDDDPTPPAAGPIDGNA